MDNRAILSLLLELAASGVMLYTTINHDANLAAALWLAIWKAAQTCARTAGRLAMRAELRYFETVKS